MRAKNILHILTIIIVISFSSCFVNSHKLSTALPEGNYIIKQDKTKEMARAYSFNDTTYLIKNNSSIIFSDYLESLTNNKIFIRHSFDIDAFTTPFKFRAAIEDVPPQLNSTFNAAIYLGYRSDHFFFRTKNVAQGIERKFSQRISYGFGGFGGLGSATINPTVLRNTSDAEYDGFVFEYGTAVVISYGNFNTGIALGADALAGKYRTNWIYQNKPWIGIIIGINLN